jgi:glycosidase
MLAWTFLLSTEGLPLVYYGDEIGLPGFNDPDNRQMMRFDGELSANEAMVLGHVQALGQARRDNLAFSRGTRTEWWGGEAEFYAYARTYEGDAVLVLLNRADSSRSVTNGVGFAGLPEGTYTDVLTGDTFSTSGDSLTVDVPALGSRVLVPQ